VGVHAGQLERLRRHPGSEQRLDLLPAIHHFGSCSTRYAFLMPTELGPLADTHCTLSLSSVPP
jgi:hypothetical protein